MPKSQFHRPLRLAMILVLGIAGLAEARPQKTPEASFEQGFTPVVKRILPAVVNIASSMANEEGYVRSASFFRPHPPFLERIISTFSEIAYLPHKSELRMDSSAFHDAKQRIAALIHKREKEEKNRPSLREKGHCLKSLNEG